MEEIFVEENLSMLISIHLHKHTSNSLPHNIQNNLKVTNFSLYIYIYII